MRVSKAKFKGGPLDGQDTGVCGDNGMPLKTRMPYGNEYLVYERDANDPFTSNYTGRETMNSETAKWIKERQDKEKP